MAEFVRITPDNMARFSGLILPEAGPKPGQEGAYHGFGLTDGDAVIGALIFRLDGEGAAWLLSAAVAEGCRGQGYGTELMIRATDILASYGDVYRIECSTVRNTKRKDALFSFLTGLGFETEEEIQGCYETTFGTLRKLKLLSGGGQESSVPFAKLKLSDKKLLYDEGLDLKPFMDAGTIEETLSCAALSGKAVKSCLMFVRDRDVLSVIWARTDTDDPSMIIRLFRDALKRSEAYADGDVLYIPVLNEASDKLANKLLGNGLKRTEQRYHAFLPLHEGMEE